MTSRSASQPSCHPEQHRGPRRALFARWGASEGPAADLASPKSSRAPARLTTIHTFYKTFLSPLLHAPALGLAGGCRFQPTCSEYAALALAQHGPARGLWLTLMRLLRCHPFTPGGWDPVPPGTRLPSSESRFAPPSTAPAGTIEKPHSTNDPA